MTRGGKRRGAGRPSGSGVERRQVKLRLPIEVHQAMVDTRVRGESVNEYVTGAIAAEAARRKDEG